MTGFEIGNKYNVFAADNNGELIKNIVLFKAKEKSDCCQRQFCHASCRSFKIFVEHDAEGASSTEGMQCAEFNRDL